MIRHDHGVCEHCRKPGILCLYRVPVGGAVVLCISCAERTSMPRWFDSVPVAVQAVRA